MSEWISVSDRLPEDRRPVFKVFIYFDNEYFDVGYYIGGQWYEALGGAPLWKVTHWQPLPEPPDAGDSTE